MSFEDCAEFLALCAEALEHPDLNDGSLAGACRAASSSHLLRLCLKHQSTRIALAYGEAAQKSAPKGEAE